MPKTSVQARAQAGTNGLGEYAYPDIGQVNPFTFFTINIAGAANDPVPAWSYYPHQRDKYLRVLSRAEPIMSGGLYSTTSRFASLRWDIPKGGRNDKKYYQELFAYADGGEGYRSFASKLALDWWTQDNGAIIELVGAGREDKELTGRVREIWHMDSAQCFRTFDPEYPVIYVNPIDNTYHRMHHTRVIMLSNFPQSDERARGIGFCAVSRVLKLMQTMRNIQTYRDEKITGRFNRGLIYGNGITIKQFDEAVEKAEAVADSLNFTVYKDIPVLLSMMPDMKLDVLDLAKLPDGFDWEKEINLYVYCLALAFGTDAREFWPATSSGATKADATVQHLKAQGKGIADLINSFETAVGWKILPINGKVGFEYDFTDDEQDRMKADLDKVKSDTISVWQTNGWIDQFEGRAIIIGEGMLDPNLLASAAVPEPADNTSPLDTETAAVLPLDTTQEPPTTPDQGGGLTNLQIAGKGTYLKKFDEQKHPRKGGKFTKKGGGTGAEQPSQGGDTTSPLAQRLDGFLSILNRTGTLNGNELTVNGATRDRSADLQTYLNNKGFKGATVTATKTAAGVVYKIEGVGNSATAKPKAKRRGRRKKVAATLEKKDDEAHGVGIKAADLESYIGQYQDELDGLWDAFIQGVIKSPAELDALLDDLYDDFLNYMPLYLSQGFDVGLQGDDPTDTGIARLKAIGQESADYFHDSFMPAVRALDISGAADAIQALLETLRARLLMYAGSMWTAIWEGLRDTTKATLRVRRVLEDGAAHCETCPPKAKVYDSFEAMVEEVGMIGTNDDCMSNCRCYLLVETSPNSDSFEALVSVSDVATTPYFEILR